MFKVGTPGARYRGAYMTDFITTRVEVSPQKLIVAPAEIRENAYRFVQELNDIGRQRPLIVAFGKHAYQLVLDNVPSHKRGPVVCLPHYSYRGLNRHEDYSQAVWSLLLNGSA